MKLIKVVYGNGHKGTVPASALGQMIARNDITAFLRAEGWVSVADGPIRKAAHTQPYSGPRRRQSDLAGYFAVSPEITAESSE